MKKKRPVLVTMLVLLAAIVAIIAVARPFRETVWLVVAIAYSDATRPNDPLTRQIRHASSGEWGDTVNLIPTPLSKGEAREGVEKLLLKGKYRLKADRDFSWHRPRAFPADSIFYGRRTDEFPCNLYFVVVVRYDSQGRLIEATGGRDEAGCL